jgi:hypothetical protein
MDHEIEDAVPAQVALMLFVSLWGILGYCALLGVTGASI